MTAMQFSIVVAADLKDGIGWQGGLPWRLSADMAYFKRLTSQVQIAGKRNAVIMGRKTWDSIPGKFRPLDGRLNIVLTRTPQANLPEGVLSAVGLDEALKTCEAQDVEQTFVIGGGAVYSEALRHRDCHLVYLTRVLSQFECDTFLPELGSQFQHLSEKDSPMQTEGAINYVFQVYKKR